MRCRRTDPSVSVDVGRVGEGTGRQRRRFGKRHNRVGHTVACFPCVCHARLETRAVVHGASWRVNVVRPRVSARVPREVLVARVSCEKDEHTAVHHPRCRSRDPSNLKPLRTMEACFRSVQDKTKTKEEALPCLARERIRSFAASPPVVGPPTVGGPPWACHLPWPRGLARSVGRTLISCGQIFLKIFCVLASLFVGQLRDG